MKILRSVLVGLSFLLAVSTVHAQQQPTLRANIPFDFVVGNRVLPAGDYLLGKQLASSTVIAVRDLDDPAAVSMAAANACSANQPSKTTKLVFHRLGGEYFLWQIWTEGQSTGREFPKSRLETQMAKNHNEKADEIVVAAVQR